MNYSPNDFITSNILVILYNLALEYISSTIIYIHIHYLYTYYTLNRLFTVSSES